MFELRTIRHADLSPQEKDEIINIKSVAWPYPYEKQVEWIDKNLKDTDIHLLLIEDNKTVAYLNLIPNVLLLDNNVYHFLGVGNVCSIERGKGYGFELMKQTNQLISEENKIGLLFCKPSLVYFYNKIGWKVAEKSRLNLLIDNRHIETMFFNLNSLFNHLTFKGQAF